MRTSLRRHYHNCVTVCLGGLHHVRSDAGARGHLIASWYAYLWLLWKRRRRRDRDIHGLEQPSDAKLAMTAESETVRAVRARRRERWVSMCKSLIGEVGATPMEGAKFRLLDVEFLFYVLLLIEYMFS